MTVHIVKKTKKVYLKNTVVGLVYRLGDSYYLRVGNNIDQGVYSFPLLHLGDNTKNGFTNSKSLLAVFHRDTEFEEIGELRCEIVEK